MTVDSPVPPEQRVLIGRITAVHGIRGWVRIQPFTENRSDIFNYQPWWLKTRNGWQKIVADDWRNTPKGLQCHLDGLDDRDEARAYCQREIYVDQALLPDLPRGEFYWSQLLNLKVVSHFQGETVNLGSVTSLLETGANDVLVVKGDAGSAIDQRERLIPYIDNVIDRVDIEAGQIDVIWDPEF